MAGKKRSRTKKLSAQTFKDNEGISNRTDDPPTNSDLPTEILELIFSQLSLGDNIRASAVCRKWLVVAASVRMPNKPPWLMLFPDYGAFYEFYDPSNRKSYFLEFPELRGARSCYSKDGWLLLYRRRDWRVFFFHPYTRKLIDLPSKELSNLTVAFSVAPTSYGCIVFTVRKIGWTGMVSTCYPGATEWTTNYFPNPLNAPIICTIWDKIIFRAGRFYCLSDEGWLGIYDPEEGIMKHSKLRPPNLTVQFPSSDWRRGKFMVEHDGDVYVIYTSPKSRPFIYKLDEGGKVLTEIGGLGRLTLFASPMTSFSRTDFHGEMRSSIYFSKVQFHGKKCVTYSPDTGRYYPRNQNYDWGKQDFGKSIWIDAPEELSIFVQRGVLMIASYHIEVSKMCHHHQMREYFSLPRGFARNHLILQVVNCNGDARVVLSIDMLNQDPNGVWASTKRFVCGKPIWPRRKSYTEFSVDTYGLRVNHRPLK